MGEARGEGRLLSTRTGACNAMAIWRETRRRGGGGEGEEGEENGKADAAAPRDLSSPRVCSVWAFK